MGLGFPVIWLATWKLQPAQRRFIVPVLGGALLLRMAMSIVFATVPATRIYHQDAAESEIVARLIANFWMGEGPPIDYLISPKNYGINYVFAGFLYVFGRFPLNAAILNSLIGTLNPLLVYAIGLKLFHEAVARRAALLAAFFPSMIIWSSMALKDPLMSFMILFALLFCVRLRERFSFVNLTGTLLPIIACYPIRFYLVYFIGASVLGTMALNRPGRRVGGLSKQVILVAGLMAVIVGFGLMGSAMEDFNSFFNLEFVSTYRHGMAASANSGFAQDVDISTPGGAIAFLPLGLSTLIWSPFPWQMVSLGPIMTLPEMLMWWSLGPALMRGFLYALRKRFSDYSPIIVFATTLLIGYSLTMGNLGAAFRMRAQVFNLLFLFVAFGEHLARKSKPASNQPRAPSPGHTLPDIERASGAR